MSTVEEDTEEGHCSGLLGRTSLRPGEFVSGPIVAESHCSGLLGRTSLRLLLFSCLRLASSSIVPAF